MYDLRALVTGSRTNYKMSAEATATTTSALDKDFAVKAGLAQMLKGGVIMGEFTVGVFAAARSHIGWALLQCMHRCTVSSAHPATTSSAYLIEILVCVYFQPPQMSPTLRKHALLRNAVPSR